MPVVTAKHARVARRQRPACAMAALALASLMLWQPISAQSALAQPVAGGQAAAATSPSQPAAATAPRLPASASITRELALDGKTLRYGATAGSIPLRDDAGAVQAEVAYLAYTRAPDADGKTQDAVGRARRPVTFVFNGGPGAASAWLNFGALGPRIISFGNEGDAPSDPPLLRDNPDSWLAFTDLVFIDPPGTGFSRIDTKDSVRRKLWSVDGDIEALATVVKRYLVEQGRLTSPKYIVGESYGGFRAPKLAHALQTGQGVGVNGVIMLSPVLDFGRIGPASDPVLGYAALLPSMTAARLEREGKTAPDVLAAAEEYARGEMVLDLLRGPQDVAAQQRLIDRVSAFTGLDPALVKARGGRIDARSFTREARRAAGDIVSAYDASIPGRDPWPFNPLTQVDDPILDGAQPVLTSAAVDEITRVIGWKPEGDYALLSNEVNRGWNWGRSYRAPEALGDLQRAAALDPQMKVLTVHGYTDLVTPYFQTRFDLATLPPLGGVPTSAQRVYPGGHMFYTRLSSRKAFLKDVQELYAAGRRNPQANPAPAPRDNASGGAASKTNGRPQ